MRRFLQFLIFVALAFVVGASFVSAQQKVGVGGNCAYLDTPVIAGEVNDFGAVMRVQYFLKMYENFPIEITGVYNIETQRFVREFQKKYSSEIFVPWGLKDPTGDVSVTTLHKMNEIYCGVEMPLSIEEKIQIVSIQKKYGVLDIENQTSSTTAVLIANITEHQKGRMAGTPIGFISEFSLPIIIMLFVLMVMQTSFMFGFMKSPTGDRVYPRKIR